MPGRRLRCYEEDIHAAIQPVNIRRSCYGVERIGEEEMVTLSAVAITAARDASASRYEDEFTPEIRRHTRYHGAMSNTRHYYAVHEQEHRYHDMVSSGNAGHCHGRHAGCWDVASLPPGQGCLTSQYDHDGAGYAYG